MIADTKELLIIVKARDDAKKVMLSAGKDIDDYANKHQSTLNKLMSHWQVFAAAGAIAFGVVAGAAAVGIKEYSEHQKAMAQVEAGIKSTGSAAGVTAKELEKYADTVQRKVAIDDEDILNMQSVLLTFPLIKNQVGATNDVFDQASTAALDLSTRLGKDLPSAAIMIGKALSDPIAGVTALRRVGVMLNDQQKENIKTMVEQGNLLGAQKVILAELTTEVGGSAEAYGKTLPGSLDKVKFAFADMAETLVSNNLPAFKNVANEVSSFLWKMADTGTLAGLFGKGMEIALHAVQALVNIMEGKNATFNTIANAFKTIAGEAIRLAPTLLKLAVAFEAFKAIKAVQSMVLALGTSLVGLSGSVGTAGAALGVFANPIGAVIGGAALLAGGIWYLTNAHKQHEKAVRENNIALGKQKDELRDSALAAQPLVAEWKNLQDTVQGSTATDEEKAAAQERLKVVTGQIADILPNAIQGWDSEGNAILANTDKMNELINAKLKYSGIKIEAKGEAGQYEGLASTFVQDQKEGSELQSIIGDVGSEIKSLQGYGGKQIFSDVEINRVTEAYSKNAKAGDDVWKTLQENEDHAADLELTYRSSDPILKEVATSTGHLTDKMKEYQTSVVETDNKLIDTRAQMKAVGQAMVGAAGEAGKAGAQMGPGLAQSMGSALISKLPALKALGTDAAAKYAEGMLQKAGQASPELARNIATWIATGADYPATGSKVGKDIYDNIKTQMQQGMVAMAGEAGGWGTAMGSALTTSVGTALKSADAVTRQGGANAAAKYAEGLFAGAGQVGPEATGMAQHIANLIATGADYDGTGKGIGKTIYDSIKSQLTGAGIVITPHVNTIPGMEALGSLLDYWKAHPLGGGETKPVKVTVEDSEAKTRIAELNQMPLDKKTARLLADGSQAQDRIGEIQRLTIADKHFKIIGDPGSLSSPFVKRSPTEIGKWMAEGIAAGYEANAAPLPAGVTGGGGGGGASAAASAWDTATAALKSYIDEMNLAEASFADADAAVKKLASTDMAWATQTAQVNAARDTQINQLELQALKQEDAGDKAGAEATRANKSAVERLKNEDALQLELSQTTVLNQGLIDKWNALKSAYDAATAKLNAYNAAAAKLTALQGVKIKGETKADDKSFKLQQTINKDHLAVLKVEQTYSQRAYVLDTQINAKKLAVLQIEQAYGQQAYELDNVINEKKLAVLQIEQTYSQQAYELDSVINDNKLAVLQVEQAYGQQAYELDNVMNEKKLAVLNVEQTYSQRAYELDSAINAHKLALLQDSRADSVRAGREGQADADFENTKKTNAAKLVMLGVEEKVRLGIATKEDYTAYEKAKNSQDALAREKELLDLQADVNLGQMEHDLVVAGRTDEALGRQKEILDLQKNIATAPLTHEEEMASQAKELLDLQKTLSTASLVRQGEMASQAKEVLDLQKTIATAPLTHEEETASQSKDILDLQKTLDTASLNRGIEIDTQSKDILDLQKTIATASLMRKEEIAAQTKEILDLKTSIIFDPLKRQLDKIFNPTTEKAFGDLLEAAKNARAAMTKLGDSTELQKSADNMKGIIDKLGTYFKTILTKVGSKQSGGYIYSQGLYELHAGERVQTAKEVSHEISGGGETHYHLYNPVFNDVRNVESFMKQLGQRTESLQRVPS